MESDLQSQPHMNSGLTRYRSAPSSYFTDILDREFCDQFFNRPSSPETERLFARFMNSGSGDASNGDDSFPQTVSPVTISVVKEEIGEQSQAVPSLNHETEPLQQQQQQQQCNINSYASAPQKFYKSSSKPPLPNQSHSSRMEANYSTGIARLPPMKTGGLGNSTLIRHMSSPAGLFSQINIDTSYVGIGGTANVRDGNANNEEASFSPSSRLKNSMNYTSGFMSPISEIGGVKGSEVNSITGEGFAESRGNNYVDAGFSAGSWDDSAIMSDNVGGVKRFREDEGTSLSGLNEVAETIQNDAVSRPRPLAHHLSLRRTSSEMAEMETFLQLSDSVPCKIRAKRGCATHPRSIAERVRRTKISERMRKLQDLVPSMDKQTNTADMLDLAVDYIKDLQNQVQKLTDARAKCTCVNHHHQQQQL